MGAVVDAIYRRLLEKDYAQDESEVAIDDGLDKPTVKQQP